MGLFASIKMDYKKPGRPSHRAMIESMSDQGLLSLYEIYQKFTGRLGPREHKIKRLIGSELEARWLLCTI
jgi:hypothetical protein